MPPINWEKIAKDRLGDYPAKYNAELAEVLGHPCPMEVDWESFKTALSEESTYYYLSSWHGYYTYEYTIYAIRSLVRFNGQDCGLKDLSKVIFRHNNNGAAPEERPKIVNNELILEMSYCCWSHGIRQSDIETNLTIHYKLFEGYKKNVNEKIIPETVKETKMVCEIDWDSFKFTEPAGDERKQTARQIQAMQRASDWSGWYSFRPITWALRGHPEEELKATFSKFVVHNRPYNPDFPHGRTGEQVRYIIESKEFHIYNVFESWWYCNSSWDIERLAERAMTMRAFGDFETMSVEQHTEKLRFLEQVCDAWATRYGDFDNLRDILRYPCFLQADNNDRHAFVTLMEYINSDEHYNAIPEDTRAEMEADAKYLRNSNPKNETFVAGWLTTKVNWKGMKQDRFVVVTDKAAYTAPAA